VSVLESGEGTDIANLTATGNSVLTTAPTDSTLVVGGVTVVTVDTFADNNGTYSGIAARIDATGTATDTANLYDSLGTNALVAQTTNAKLTNTAPLATAVNSVVSVSKFGAVNAYMTSGTSDTVSEQAIDFALKTIGNWTTIP
jgi:hypothetical protein